MLSGLALVALFAVGPADVALAHSGVARAAHRATSSSARAARLPAVGELRLHSRLMEGGETPRGGMQLDLRLAQRRRRGATGTSSTAPATGASGTTGAAGASGASGTSGAAGTGSTPTPTGGAAAGGSSTSAPVAGTATGGGGGAAAATPADGDPATDAPASGGAAATSGDGATPAATTSGDGAAAAGGDGAAADSGGGEDEPNIELLRHRAQLTRVHRPVGIATWASMIVTEALGTIRIFNMGVIQPIPPAPGQPPPPPSTPAPCGNRDAMGQPIGAVFGDFGCGGLTGLHGVSSFVTTALYTTTAILAASMPDPERASEGNDRRATILRLHRGFRWVHLIGMIALPLLGMMAVTPESFGVRFDPLSPGPAIAFGNVVRTLHMIFGYVTLSSLTASMILELI